MCFYLSIKSNDNINRLIFIYGYDYYASARMVASQLNHQIILLLMHPLTQGKFSIGTEF